MIRMSRALAGLFNATMVVFMVTPLVLVVLFSFGRSKLTSFPMGGFSTVWYESIFGDPEFWGAFWNSLIVAGSVCSISTVVGTLAGFALVRLPGRMVGITILCLCLPIMLPALVVGIALLVFYVSVGTPLSLATVIASHVLITQPFVILIIYARMIGFDHRVVESARDLGATPWQTFRTVTLPIIRPTIIGAALIALAISLDEVVITFFTLGGGNTIPTLVFGMMRRTLGPQINAIGTLLLLLTLTSTAIALVLTRYRG